MYVNMDKSRTEPAPNYDWIGCDADNMQDYLTEELEFSAYDEVPVNVIVRREHFEREFGIKI